MRNPKNRVFIDYLGSEHYIGSVIRYPDGWQFIGRAVPLRSRAFHETKEAALRIVKRRYGGCRLEEVS